VIGIPLVLADEEPAVSNRGKGKERSSRSVSVSVSSPPVLILTGRAFRLNSLTLSSPSSFFSGKCTDFDMKGVEGTDCTRKCRPPFPRSSSGIDDAEAEDLSEDFKGLPLERRIGCEEPRERVGRRGGSRPVAGDATSEGVSVGDGDKGEETGNGTLPACAALSSFDSTLGGEYRPPLVVSDGDRKLVVSMLNRATVVSSCEEDSSSSSSSLK
jgi:hypothetical protein